MFYSVPVTEWTISSYGTEHVLLSVYDVLLLQQDILNKSGWLWPTESLYN